MITFLVSCRCRNVCIPDENASDNPLLISGVSDTNAPACDLWPRLASTRHIACGIDGDIRKTVRAKNGRNAVGSPTFHKTGWIKAPTCSPGVKCPIRELRDPGAGLNHLNDGTLGATGAQDSCANERHR